MDIETTTRLLERRAKDAKRQREKRAKIKLITKAMQTPPTWINKATQTPLTWIKKELQQTPRPAPPKATKGIEAMKVLTPMMKWVVKDAKAMRREKDAKRQREKRAAIKKIMMAMQTPQTWTNNAMPLAQPKATKDMEAMKVIDTKTMKWITKDAKAIRREKNAKAIEAMKVIETKTMKWVTKDAKAIRREKEAKKDDDADAKDADELFGPCMAATISRFV